MPPPAFPQGSDLLENAVSVGALMWKVRGSSPLHNEKLHAKFNVLTAVSLLGSEQLHRDRGIAVPEDEDTTVLRNVGRYLPIGGTVSHHGATETSAGEAECKGRNWIQLAQDSPMAGFCEYGNNHFKLF